LPSLSHIQTFSAALLGGIGISGEVEKGRGGNLGALLAHILGEKGGGDEDVIEEVEVDWDGVSGRMEGPIAERRRKNRGGEEERTVDAIDVRVADRAHDDFAFERAEDKESEFHYVPVLVPGRR
jgi:hypothetical protein